MPLYSISLPLTLLVVWGSQIRFGAEQQAWHLPTQVSVTLMLKFWVDLIKVKMYNLDNNAAKNWYVL